MDVRSEVLWIKKKENRVRELRSVTEGEIEMVNLNREVYICLIEKVTFK